MPEEIFDPIILYKKDDKGKYGEEQFLIGEVIGHGRSSMCYEAKTRSGTTGVLKEFDPFRYEGIRADNTWMDLSGPFGEAEDYDQVRMNRYVRIHQELKTFKDDKENRELSTFLPTYEIYYKFNDDGSSENSKPVKVCLWEPEPPKKTLQDICDEMLAQPERDTEGKIRFIIESMIACGERIRAMHMRRWVLRDNNPNNIGFRMLGGRALPEHMTIFDTDSFCPINEMTDNCIGTEGYLSPDYIDEETRPSEKMKVDLYSLGGILYFSLTGGIYRNEYFPVLGDCVRESKLISALRENIWPRLADDLTDILRNSLCGSAERYTCCEEILDDLNEILDYMESEKPFSKAWNQELYHEKYWCMQLMEDAPPVLASHYRELYYAVRMGNESKTIGLIRNVFVLMLRIPAIYLFNNVFSRIYVGAETSERYRGIIERNPPLEAFCRKALSNLNIQADGWWECVCLAAQIDKDVLKEGAAEDSEICGITIEYLSYLHDEFQKMQLNMVEWCHENFDYGSLVITIEHSAQIRDILRTFSRVAGNSLNFYHQVLLADKDRCLLRGADTSVSDREIQLCCQSETADTQRYYDMHSFMEGNEKFIACYDGYEKGSANLFVYNTSKRYKNKDLSDYLNNMEDLLRSSGEDLSFEEIAEELIRKRVSSSYIRAIFQLAQKARTNLKAAEENLEILEQKLSAAEEMIGLPFLYQWLMDVVEGFDKGVFLLSAPGGYGKSAFTRCINPLEPEYTCVFNQDRDRNVAEAWEKFRKHTLIRVCHFRDDSRFDENAFIADVRDVCAQESPVPDEEKRDFTHRENTPFVSLDIINQSQFARCLQNALDYHKDKYGFNRILLVVDGLDEAIRFEKLRSILPGRDMLGENVYILYTCRTYEEIKDHSGLLQFLSEIKFEQVLEFCADSAYAVPDRTGSVPGEDSGTYRQSREGYFEKDNHIGRQEGAAGAAVDYNEMNNYREAVYQYLADIYEKENCSFTRDDLERAAKYFEYRFSSLAAYKELCSKSPVFLDCYKNDKDLFAAFLEQIHEKSTDAYANGIENLLKILAWAGEPITLQELEYLSGQDFFAGDLASMLHDVGAFISISRSSRGNLYGYSHAQWREAVLMKFGDGIREFRMRCEELLDEIFQYFDEENIVSVLDTDHQGELWILTHILQVWERDYPLIKQCWWEKLRIDKVERLIQLILHNEKIQDMYYRDIHSLQNSGPVKQMIDGLMTAYCHAVNEFNQFNDYFLDQDFTRGQIGNYLASDEVFSEFFSAVYEKNHCAMTENQNAAFCYQASSVFMMMPGLWGPEPYGKACIEAALFYLELAEQYVQTDPSGTYSFIRFKMRNRLAGVYEQEGDYENALNMLMSLVGMPRKTDLKMAETFLNKEKIPAAPWQEADDRLRSADELAELAHVYVRIGELAFPYGFPSYEGRNKDVSFSAFCRAYNILQSLPETSGNVSNLIFKYRAELGIAVCTGKSEAWQESIETAQQLLNKDISNYYSHWIRDGLYGAGVYYWDNGEHETAVYCVQQACQVCIRYHLEVKKVISELHFFYEELGSEPDEEYDEIWKEIDKGCPDSHDVIAEVANILKAYTENGLISDYEFQRIPDSVMTQVVQQRYRVSYTLIKKPRHPMKYKMEEKTADILIYLNRHYMHNQWLGKAGGDLKRNYETDILEWLLNDINYLLISGQDLSDTEIASAECAEVLWVVRNIPAQVRSRIPKEVMEKIAEKANSGKWVNFSGTCPNKYRKGTLLLMARLLDYSESDLIRTCEIAVKRKKNIKRVWKTLEKFKILHSEYYCMCMQHINHCLG